MGRGLFEIPFVDAHSIVDEATKRDGPSDRVSREGWTEPVIPDELRRGGELVMVALERSLHLTSDSA